MSVDKKVHAVTEVLQGAGWKDYAAEEKARNIVSLLLLEETGNVAEKMRLIQASLPRPTNHKGMGKIGNGVAKDVLDAYQKID